MPTLPAYWMPRPPLPLEAATRAEFEQLYQTAVAPGAGGSLDYRLAAPKWQFLCYLADHYPLVLHGSGQPDIALFEPRQSDDVNPFGNQRAVYAAADGLWPMFFAVVDRDRYALHVVNACIRFAEGAGSVSEPYYFFSVSHAAQAPQPWRNGTVYLLPAAGFASQPPMQSDGLIVHVPQVASPLPVRPLAKLSITPADFPFLPQIRRHDTQVIAARSAANPEGFPWVDEERE